MSLNRYACLALCGALLAIDGYGYGVVTEWGPYSEEAGDYAVYYYLNSPPDITILHPSTPGTPYWFECYEGDEPAAIRSITAAPGIGTVEVKVTGYGSHTYGASDIWSVQIHQTSGGGRLVELKISGDYGDVDNGDTLIADSAETLSIAGDVATPVQIGAGGLGTLFLTGGISSGAPVTIAGDVSTCEVHGDIAADVAVTGNVTVLRLYGTTSAHVTVGGTVGSSSSTVFNVGGFGWLDGTLEIQGDLIGMFFGYDLAGCLYVAGDLAPCGALNFSIDRIWGTLCVGGNLGDSSATVGMNVGELRHQAELNVGGSIVGPINFGNVYGVLHVAGGAEHDGGVLAAVEIDRDITGRIEVDAYLDSSIHTPWGLVSYPEMPPEDGAVISVARSVTESGSIELGGALDGGRIEVGTLAGTIEMGDLAGMVHVGQRYTEQDPMSGSIIINGTMSGDIFLDRGFLSGALVQIDGQKVEDALFVVNADGPDLACDVWDGGTLLIDSQQYYGPDQDDLWALGCLKGDADASGALNSFDISPFVLMLSDPSSYCAARPWMCGGATDPPGGAYLYVGDLNCDGAVNVFDIDPFVLKLTNRAAYYSQFPPSCEVLETAFGVQYMGGECCQSCGSLMAMVPEGGLDDAETAAVEEPEGVANLIVENVSADLRPALLRIAAQLATELPDPDRAAVWAAVAEQLSGE